eukprot:3379829-Pleurochrysis_carterae.AAC.1
MFTCLPGMYSLLCKKFIPDQRRLRSHTLGRQHARTRRSGAALKPPPSVLESTRTVQPAGTRDLNC